MIMKNEKKTGYLNIDSVLYRTRISEKYLGREKFSPDDKRIVRSYIPGTITEIFISLGQEVCAGDEIMILEAMKMKNRIKAGCTGKIKSILVKEGDKVAKGSLLVELE
jgi:biotin carboxyl carrier protein